MLKTRRKGSITFSMTFLILISLLLVAVYGHYKSTSEVLHTAHQANQLTTKLETVSKVTNQVLIDTLKNKDYGFTWDGYAWVTTSNFLDPEDVTFIEEHLESITQTELALPDPVDVQLQVYDAGCSAPYVLEGFVNPYTTSVCIQSTVSISGVSLVSSYLFGDVVYDFNPSAVIGVVSAGSPSTLTKSFVY